MGYFSQLLRQLPGQKASKLPKVSIFGNYVVRSSQEPYEEQLPTRSGTGHEDKDEPQQRSLTNTHKIGCHRRKEREGQCTTNELSKHISEVSKT